MLKQLIKNQKGDTIVEILISLAVLGSIMGISYALANRSLRGTVIAQDRTGALKVAEGQVELLKYTAQTNNTFDSNYRSNPGHFCFDKAAPHTKHTESAWPNYDSQCRNDISRGLTYRIDITYQGSSTAPFDAAQCPATPAKCYGNYAIYVEWDSLTGKTENLTINYQL